jgi:hypothetical protein
LVLIGCDLTSCPSVGRTICPFNGAPNLWISIDHLVMAITSENATCSREPTRDAAMAAFAKSWRRD